MCSAGCDGARRGRLQDNRRFPGGIVRPTHIEPERARVRALGRSGLQAPAGVGPRVRTRRRPLCRTRCDSEGSQPGRLHCRKRAFVRELARWGRAGLFWAVCCGMARDSFRVAAFAKRVGTSWIGSGGWGGAEPEACSGLREVGLMWWQSRECCVKIRPPASGRVTPGC